MKGYINYEWERLPEQFRCSKCGHGSARYILPKGSDRLEMACDCKTLSGDREKVIKEWSDYIEGNAKRFEDSKLQLGRKKGQGQAWRSPKFDRRKRKAVSIIYLTDPNGIYGKRKLGYGIPSTLVRCR